MKKDFPCLNELVEHINAEVEESERPVENPKPKRVIVVGSTSTEVPGLISDLQQYVGHLRPSGRAGSLPIIASDDSRWADYMVAFLRMSQPVESDYVFHVFHPDASAGLENLIKDSNAQRPSLNGWLDPSSLPDDALQDALNRVRPPRNGTEWMNTAAIIVLSLAEAAQALKQLDSHVSFIQTLLKVSLRCSTTEEDRTALENKLGTLFNEAQLKTWRTESGLKVIPTIEKNLSPIQIPTMVVIARGDLVEDLRSREYAGQRDLIEAAVVLKCSEYGLPCLLVDSRPGKSANIETMIELISIMSCEDASNAVIGPPRLPSSLDPRGTSEGLLWVPPGLLSKSEIDAAVPIQLLGDQPFDLAVTFCPTLASTTGGLQLPTEAKPKTLKSLIESMDLVEYDGVSSQAEVSASVGIARDTDALSADRGEGGEPKELKAFFGDMVKKKKQALRTEDT